MVSRLPQKMFPSDGNGICIPCRWASAQWPQWLTTWAIWKKQQSDCARPGETGGVASHASCFNLDDCLCAVPHVFAEPGAAHEALLALLGRCRSLVSTVIVGCWWVTQGTSRAGQDGEHATSPAWPTNTIFR
jgi:hypothetical protein